MRRRRTGRRDVFHASPRFADGEANRTDGRENSHLSPLLLEREHRARLGHDDVPLWPQGWPAGLGTGSIHELYRDPRHAAFWKDQLKRHKVDQSEVEERFGQKFLRFRHPAGLAYEVIEDKDDRREGWTTPEVGKGEALHGFHGAVLSVREIEETERFFIEALGFRKSGVDGAYHRYETGTGGANKTITLVHEPDRPAGSWTFGAGTVHHIALWGADDQALADQKAIYEELGYTDASEIKDRFYFHSMYCRSPGGILVESCCNVPGGFEKDEPKEKLGTKLHLPPWFADRHAEILAELEPIQVPETATAAA